MITAICTPEQFEHLKSTMLANEDVHLTGNHGTIAKDGVAANVQYQPETATLHIQVTKTPMLVTLGYVEGKIRDGLKAAGVTPS